MNKEKFKKTLGKTYKVKASRKVKTCKYKDCGFCKKFNCNCFQCHL